MLQKKEDRRIRKTRKQLCEALTTLMQQKPIQEIKVKEIADLIDINRGTFYQHYTDIYDLMYSIEDDVFKQFNELLEHYEEENNNTLTTINLSPFLEALLNYMKENSNLVKALLGPYGDFAFVLKLRTLVREKALDSWMKQHHNTDHMYFDYYCNFVVSGCVEVLTAWIKNGMQEDVSTMSKMIESFIMNGIKILEG